MEIVCWICGYTPEERREQGAEPGQCGFPREVRKDPRRCALNAPHAPTVSEEAYWEAARDRLVAEEARGR
jgi:hypothetical protein